MGRSPCCSDKNGLKKGPWTPEEDQKLIHYIQKNGYGNWRTLPQNAGLDRCGKSCRLRWTNYLRPDIKRGKFSFEEEETIIHLHSILGNKWSAIAGRLPGRTDNEIKNHWNTHIRKRLLRMGIDPVTHTPRLDLLHLSTILSNSPSLLHSPFTMQNLINNSHLIRLASSFFSSHTQNQDFLIQNHQQNQLSHQIPHYLFQSCPLQTTHVQDFQLMQNDGVQQYPQNVSGFGSTDDWQQQSNGSMISTLTEDHFMPVPEYGGFHGSGQQVMVDPALSTDPSTFESNGCSNSFSFQSVISNISTPSSSLTQLHSNNNNNNNNSSTEEEKEISYGGDMLKFEIPDILDDINYGIIL